MDDTKYSTMNDAFFSMAMSANFYGSEVAEDLFANQWIRFIEIEE